MILHTLKNHFNITATIRMFTVHSLFSVSLLIKSTVLQRLPFRYHSETDLKSFMHAAYYSQSPPKRRIIYVPNIFTLLAYTHTFLAIKNYTFCTMPAWKEMENPFNGIRHKNCKMAWLKALLASWSQ